MQRIFQAVAIITIMVNMVSTGLTRDSLDKYERVYSDRTTILTMERIASALKDAETGQRGFLLTEDKEYLEPYEAALVDLPNMISDIEELNVTVRDKKRLQTLITNKINELRRTVELELRGQHEGALTIVKTNEGKRVMDDIRNTINKIKIEAEKSLVSTRENLTGLLYTIKYVFILNTIVSFITIIVFIITLFTGRT